MKPPPISPGRVRMYFCEVIPSRTDTCCIFNGSTRKKHYWSPSEPAFMEVNGPSPTNFHAAGQGHNSPGQQPWNKPKKPKESLNELQRTFPSLSPVQITAALPKNFLPKPKPWLCLQNFYLRKHAMTFYIITTLFRRETGKNKKRRRQSKKKKTQKSTPTTSSNKSLCSYLLSNGLSIETYFMWQALLLFFFFFF